MAKVRKLRQGLGFFLFSSPSQGSLSSSILGQQTLQGPCWCPIALGGVQGHARCHHLAWKLHLKLCNSQSSLAVSAALD